MMGSPLPVTLKAGGRERGEMGKVVYEERRRREEGGGEGRREKEGEGRGRREKEGEGGRREEREVESTHYHPSNQSRCSDTPAAMHGCRHHWKSFL